MYPIYKDIRNRLGAPLWHDSYGVPRYDEFHPKLLGIYDKYAVLFLVQCQTCHQLFPCAFGMPGYHFVNDKFDIIDNVDDFLKYVTWGDAPYHEEEQQCSGTTMSTSIVKLLSVWSQESGKWESLEITQAMTDAIIEW